jgi:transcriptional regulator with XRE-family HTH domain
MSIQPVTIPQFDIADRLRKAREVSGYSQEELAETMGIARSTVSNYEAGVTTHHRRIVMQTWAWATSVPVEWLMYGVTPETPGDQASKPSGCFADRHLRAA